jgi:hypothetical protein
MSRNFNKYKKFKQPRQTRLLHNNEKLLFINFYNHYLSKNSELKKPSAKVKISNLNNYSAVCFRNGKGTTILFFFSCDTHQGKKEKEGNIHKSLGGGYRGRHYSN